MTTRAIKPLTKPFDVRFELPGSKSYGNRALVCAALAGAPCTIANISPSDDTALMMNVLSDLGWALSRPNPTSPDVRLAPPRRPSPGGRFFTGEAGTATRFTAALLAAMPGRFELNVAAAMQRRPMDGLFDVLRQLGAKIAPAKPGSAWPVVIEGGTLGGGVCALPGGVSSQFLSALLMVAPCLPQPSAIRIEGELVSRSYVDITLEVMRAFGLPPKSVSHEGYRTFYVQPSRYVSPPTFACPPDAGGAGYFWAAAAISGGCSVVDGLSLESPQGDVQLARMLARMGCELVELPGALGIRGTSKLNAIEAELSDLPDCALTLAVVAAFARGTSLLRGLGTLRHKESDRLSAVCAALAKLGVEAGIEADDSLRVNGTGGTMRPGGSINTYRDHRMAMSFALAGLRTPLQIEDPGVVSKSFPAFWQYFDRLYA